MAIACWLGLSALIMGGLVVDYLYETWRAHNQVDDYEPPAYFDPIEDAVDELHADLDAWTECVPEWVR